jgi:uncharacterized protein (TIGR02246 family)
VANHQVDELARRYSEAWNAHDLETIISMHAEDSTFRLHGGPPPAEGIKEVRAAFEGFLAQYPNMRFEERALLVGPDHWALEYELTGVTGGTEARCTGVDVIVARNGLVARKETYLDRIALRARREELRAASSAA